MIRNQHWRNLFTMRLTWRRNERQFCQATPRDAGREPCKNKTPDILFMRFVTTWSRVSTSETGQVGSAPEALYYYDCSEVDAEFIL